MTAKMFISYCHDDEWLKDEFHKSLATLIRNNEVEIWHDRLIEPGAEFDQEIIDRIQSSDIMILLISSSFIASDYCYNVEFKKALSLKSNGKLEIVPVIVRATNFDIEPLKNMLFLPKDARPVNPNGASRVDFELRDQNWSNVSRDLGNKIKKMKSKSYQINLSKEHVAERVKNLNFQHVNHNVSDISDFFQEPEIVHTENDHDQSLGSISDLASQLSEGLHFLSGDDQSGKTTTLFVVQQILADTNIPSVIISGSRINNNQVDDLINDAVEKQLVGNKVNNYDLTVLIDDFDECKLSEARQRKFLTAANSKYKSILATCYSRAFAKAFDATLMEHSQIYAIEQLPVNKVYELIENWILCGRTDHGEEAEITVVYQSVIGLLNGGAVPAYPPMILLFLRVSDSVRGADLSMTSNAACYDSLISLELNNHKVPPNRIDAAKNFLGFFAGNSFEDDDMRKVSLDKFEDIKSQYNNIFFDEILFAEPALFDSKILQKDDGYISFKNKFLGYFFVGRYMALYLKNQAPENYETKVSYHIKNVRYRASANILLYCIYFSNDVSLLDRLMGKLDEKFSEVPSWQLTNTDVIDQNIGKSVLEALELSDDVRNERFKTIKASSVSKYNEDGQFEDYANPYSSTLKNLLVEDDLEDKPKTFIGEMNSLFRLQSILGSALNTRQGTFTGLTILKCAASVVESAGRFSIFNLNLARSLSIDLEECVELIKARFPHEDFEYLDSGSDQYKREMDNFISENVQAIAAAHGRWIVFSAQTVAGRILSGKTALEALRRLAESEGENESNAVNYQIAYGISKLFNTAKIDRDLYDSQTKKHGINNLVFQTSGYSVYVFSRFMPISHEDRHWLNSKFNFRKGLINVRQRKFLPKHSTKLKKR